MHSYDSITEALEDLKKRGYTEDFNLKPHCLECRSGDIRLHPEDFSVDEVYRFEGASNPDDSSILFAISSKDGIKGTLVDAYGMYAENLNGEMIRKLTMPRH